MLKNQAKNKTGKIILPEANLDDRVKLACEKILKEKLSDIIIFGNDDDFPKYFKNNSHCEIVDINNKSKQKEMANLLFELRKEKGMSLNEAKKLVKNPIYFACLMLKKGDASGMVAGAHFTTADTLRPALQIVKTKPNKSVVSSCMLMTKKNISPMLFADVSIIKNPTSENLCEIAISTAEFMKNVLGIEPKVAMLSYSTNGSASDDSIDKIKQAVKQANQQSEYQIDGEMQADVALSPIVAKKKGMGGMVAGEANVLVFPDLNSANISYKLVARLGNFVASGPIMLGFNKPVSDLSRGCNVEEIINAVMITKLQIENN